MTERLCIRTDDGWTLVGDRRGDGPMVVVVGHAMMVSRRSLDRPPGRGLVSTLVDAGFEVLSFDVRGHGESGPGADIGGRYSYDDIVRHDLPAMIAAARACADGRPVAIVGHSLVGHAAMIHAGLDPEGAADCIVALAPNLWAPHLEPSPLRRAVKAGLLAAWAASVRVTGYFDAPRRGWGSEPIAREYIDQFHAMWQGDRLASPGGDVDYEAALARAELPVLVYSSDRDRLLAHPEAVDAFVGMMARAEVEVRRLRDGPTHMGFVNSQTSRPTWLAIAEWLLFGPTTQR